MITVRIDVPPDADETVVEILRRAAAAVQTSAPEDDQVTVAEVAAAAQHSYSLTIHVKP